MAPKIIKACTRTARKKHPCSYCGEHIETGEKYIHYTLAYEGEIYDWKTHPECDYVASELWDFVDPGDGMTEEEFREGCREFCRCFVCPDCDRFAKDAEDCLDDNYFCIRKIHEILKANALVRSRNKYGYFCFKLKPREKEGNHVSDT